MDRIAREALDAHHQLDVDISRLRQVIDASVEPDPALWCGQCRDQFQRFHTALRRHIDMEEADGFLKPVRQLRPTLTPQVDQLFEEHRAMIVTCEQLENDFRNCSVLSQADALSLQKRTIMLLQELERHEHVENAMVQEVLTRDIGTKD
jgi:hypothetical protein